MPRTIRIGAVHVDQTTAVRDDRRRFVFTHVWQDADGNTRIDRIGGYDRDALEAQRAQFTTTTTP